MDINQHWKTALLSIESTLQDAIQNLNNSSMQIIVVVSKQGKLEGTITDGDIRRGLLRGLTMGHSIASIVHRDPFVVPKQLDRDTVLQLMHANNLRQIPVVSSDGYVVGLHLWDKLALPQQRSNLMLIMAGGEGKRLRPHTENCPKPMLFVRGKPMLEHIIEKAKAESIVHFIIAVHYLRHMVEDYFGDGSAWQVKINYLREESPLGTAGALCLLNPQPTLPFLVSNGDVLTDIRYGELLDFHSQHQAVATMAVRPYEWQNPFGVVQTKGLDIVGLEEKPISRVYVNTGIYVLDPQMLALLHKNESCDMPTLFARLRMEKKRAIVYPMHEPWLDVGYEKDLIKANVSQSEFCLEE